MRKAWLVAKHEYLKIVRKRTFLVGTLGMPLLIVAIMAISILVAIGSRDTRPLGYVDRAGVLKAGITPAVDSSGDKMVEMRAFADEAAARAALETGQIQAFYVLPADYLQSLKVTLYYWTDTPGDTARSNFKDFVRANLVAGLPDAVRERAYKGVDLTVRSADGRQEVSGNGLVNILLPFGVGFFFIFVVMNSAGYLLQAVTDEKESRTVEVMATSLTPDQLIGGKAAGLIAVALTQILILVITIGIGLAIGSQFLEWLRAAKVPWGFLGIVAAYFVPAFVLIAGMSIAIGSAVTETRQGQQIAGVLNLLFTIPYFFIVVFFTTPNSPIATILTLFPTTSFITITLRWGVTTIPVWELAVSWIVLAACAGLSIWAAARIFRAGMLSYGQRLNLKGMLQAVQARAR